MNKESLEIVSERIHILVDDPRIPIYEKVELLINFSHFLNKYEKNIQVLEEHRRLELKREREEE